MSHFGLQNKDGSLQANKNISGAQKESMLWHLELGMHMSHVHCLTKVSVMHEPNERVSAVEWVIVPKVNVAANCEITLCKSCNLSRARQRKAKVVRSKATKSSVGAISQDKYVYGDFVSMDQCVVKEPDQLPTGLSRDTDHNRFHGGTILCDASLKYIFIKNQVSLGAGKAILSKHDFESWLWDTARVVVKYYHSGNGVFTAETFTDSCKEEG